MSHDPVRVVVVGAGGVGSVFLHGLVRALEFGAPGSMVIIVDGDAYEEKNAERQIFSKLGNKAQVIRNDLAPLFPSTSIIALSAWVVSEGKQSKNADPDEPGISKMAPSQILQENDFVFPLVDNFAARLLMFDAAANYDNIDIITGGNEDDLTGSTWHHCRREGKNVTRHPLEIHTYLADHTGKNPGELSCEERAKLEGGTQILAANMGVASLLLAKVSAYMLGTSEQKAQQLSVVETQFDWSTGQSVSFDWPLDESEVVVEEVGPVLASATA